MLRETNSRSAKNLTLETSDSEWRTGKYSSVLALERILTLATISRFSYFDLFSCCFFPILCFSYLYYLFSVVIVMIDDIVKYIIYFLIPRLTFQFSPSSKVYGFSEVDLVRNGGDQVCVEKAGDEIKNVGSFSP